MHIHSREYYAVNLIAYGVDPWLFDSYNRVHAARIHPDIRVTNRVRTYDRATKTITSFMPRSVERYNGESLRASETLGLLIADETAFLSAWMSDAQNMCCDSIECTESLPGSASVLPVLSTLM